MKVRNPARKPFSFKPLRGILVSGPALLTGSLAPAEAEPPQYFLFDVGEPDVEYTAEVIIFGMNNLGECVGLVQDFDGSGDFEAVVWLPNDNYGLERGMHSLETITGMTPVNGGQANHGTVAFDINDAGIAVGRLWTAVPPTANAFVWKLHATSPDAFTIGSTNIGAWSINNDADPIITGGGGHMFEYTGPFFFSFNPVAGFYYKYDIDGSNDVFDSLDVPGIQGRMAYGIADTISSNALIAGFMDCDTTDEDCDDSPYCYDEYDGALWTHITATAAQLEPLDFSLGASMFVIGHAASNDGYVVGFGRDPSIEDIMLECRQFSHIWLNPTNPNVGPTVLPVLRPQEPDTELALDIRNSQGGGIDVVGRNTTLGVAVRWRSNIFNTEWTVLNLNDSGVVYSMGNFNTLKSANAVNDNGWIAGFGDQGGGEDPIVDRSFVLVPYSEYVELCPADLAGSSTTGPDGMVDVFDLFVLLQNWNTDGLGANLAEDEDVVDVFDLFVLLDAWGGCVGPIPDYVDTLEETVTGAGLTMADWDEYIDVLTESEDEDEIENYNCWMRNYLTDCTFCPPCPDQDPFKNN